jgi:hypothetical protein
VVSGALQLLEGNIFQKLEKVQGALEMCQKALNDFMVPWRDDLDDPQRRPGHHW